jgi:hypothetical protein
VLRFATRHSQVEKSFATEERLYQDLESFFGSLDRELQRLGS